MGRRGRCAVVEGCFVRGLYAFGDLTYFTAARGPTKPVTPKWCRSLRFCSKQAEDSFNRDPSGRCAALRVFRRNELPAAYRAYGVFIQAKPDPARYLQVSYAAVRANQYAHGH